MMSVGNNFFYTLSLPCSLWFFDKGKKEELLNKVLFIDARNYYTFVDRNLNEWTEWQLNNLQAIVHLYRGEQEKYKSLIENYKETILSLVEELDDKALPFCELVDEGTKGHFLGLMGWIKNAGFDITELKLRIGNQLDQTKACIKSAESIINKRNVKSMRKAGEDFCSELNDILTIISEYDWLTSKFGTEGDYQDVLGLCKIATISEIEEKNWSLTPGAYVGVAEVEDDGVDFHERMNEIHAELSQLNAEANVLMNEIMKEWGDLNTK